MELIILILLLILEGFKSFIESNLLLIESILLLLIEIFFINIYLYLSYPYFYIYFYFYYYYNLISLFFNLIISHIFIIS